MSAIGKGNALYFDPSFEVRILGKDFLPLEGVYWLNHVGLNSANEDTAYVGAGSLLQFSLITGWTPDKEYRLDILSLNRIREEIMKVPGSAQ